MMSNEQELFWLVGLVVFSMFFGIVAVMLRGDRDFDKRRGLDVSPWKVVLIRFLSS